ncbi:transglutaminase domain-containing protein [Sulfobacillus harzensis]|uniref:transglutaminase-like domain-containing protein n=1 Tax=Sulfobacillus harzensis TaxID=2729629 RepID=UPI0030841CDC
MTSLYRRSAVAAATALALFIGTPSMALAATVSGNSAPAVTSLPAYYGFTKTVTITNTGNAPALNVTARVVLLAPPTAYAHVTLSGYSQEPSSTYKDSYGNLIGEYRWSEIQPHQSITLTLHYQATSSDVSYHLPSTYGSYNTASKVYREYTNPHLEAKQVDTDAAPIKAEVQALVGNMTNPYQRAQTLFNWVAQNIRYNYSLQASGSALATLESRLGICSDIADLYVSMLRTDGIPARLIGGYVTNNGDGQGGFHQWVEFYLPHTGWVVADPTWGKYGYFASLQDDWHIPLYDGIRPDISVHWRYAKSQTASPYLAIHYHYQFNTEQSPAASRHVKLPLVSVTPPVAKHQMVARTVESEWQRVLSAVRQYFLRLKIALESL